MIRCVRFACGDNKTPKHNYSYMRTIYTSSRRVVGIPVHVCMHGDETMVHGHMRTCAIYVHVCGTRYDMCAMVRLLAVQLTSHAVGGFVSEGMSR